MKSIQAPLSRFAVYAVLAYAILFFFIQGENRKPHIVSDVISYYAYIPATLVYHDLRLEFIRGKPKEFSDKIWPEMTPDGKMVIKTTMGLAILYAPFALLGHAYASMSSYPANGFSQPYHTSLVIACLCYLVIGLLSLRRILLRYFDDRTSALTLLCLYFGTNLLWYTTREAAMAHGFIFSLLCVFLWATLQWYEQPSLKRSIALGLLGGLAVLIRPTLVLLALPFLLYGVDSWQALRAKPGFLWRHAGRLLAMVLCGLLPFGLQMLYWKYATGQWLYYSYTGERFYFDHPNILNGLFSFRKGWFVYTPMMAFALLGMALPYRPLRNLRLGIVALWFSCVYIIFSWWCWWYGGSFGQRSMVDFYGFFALFLGVSIAWLSARHLLLRIPAFILLTALIAWNMFQHWQFKEALISSDGMTRASFLTEPFRTERSARWLATLRPPDYTRARAGLSFEHPPVQPGWEVFSLLDFEEGPMRYDTLLAREPVMSGQYAYTIDRSMPYTPAIRIQAHELKSIRVDSVLISADVYAVDSIGPDDLSIIGSLENDTAKTFFLANDLGSDETFPGKRWLHFELRFPFPSCDSRDFFKAYVLSAKGGRFYVDNLRLEIR